MVQTYIIAAVGRAFTDVIASVSPEFLQRHNIPLDGQREFSINELKEIQKSLSQSQMIPGGAAACTASTVAALGGTAGFFGKVYRDFEGNSFVDDLIRRKIALCCNPYAQYPATSAICIDLLTEDKRSFAYNPGCADHLTVDDFDKFDFSSTMFFLLEAHLLTSLVAKSPLIEVLNRAKHRTKLVINLQGIVQWKDNTAIQRYIASNADIIIGNNAEHLGFSSVDISRPPYQLNITTKGENGAQLTQIGEPPQHFAAQAPRSFVDSIGAGDAFLAGFLFAQSLGYPLSKSMHFAMHTASALIEETGARPQRSLTDLLIH